jgi:signal transduction histidine kinase
MVSRPVDSFELTQLGHIVERLPTGVILLDSAGVEVTYANVAAQRLLHPVSLRTRRLLPDPWPSFSLPRYAAGLVQRGVAAEKRIDVGNGRVYLINGLSARGETPAAILLRDITEHNRRGRAEAEFITNAAHELLTPLTGIVGAAHVLEAGAKNVPEDRDRFVAHIATECNRLARIARSLLVLARAQSGEEPPRLEILELQSVLDEVVEQVEADVTVRGTTSVTVLADADLLVQALTNLIANAARHGGDRNEIAFEARQADGLVEIDVLGGGSEGEDVPQMRRRFHSGAGRDSGGFGLGLSIAEQSLEVMGGHLVLDGPTVRVRIPTGGYSPR